MGMNQVGAKVSIFTIEFVLLENRKRQTRNQTKRSCSGYYSSKFVEHKVLHVNFI